MGIRLGNVVPDITYLRDSPHHWLNIDAKLGDHRRFRDIGEIATIMQSTTPNGGRRPGGQFMINAVLPKLSRAPATIRVAGFEIALPWSKRSAKYLFVGQTVFMFVSQMILSY